MKWYLKITALVLTICAVACISSCSKDDDKAVYTVTFETDGGTPVPSAQQVEEGTPATVPATNPAKAGYVFMFWHVSGASTAYNFQTPVNNDITLHAKWQEEAVVEYWQVAWELNGGLWPAGDNHATQVVKGGTLAEPAEPVKEGSTFDGWYKEAALTNKILFPYDVSGVTGNFTLHAKWETVGTEPSDSRIFTSVAALKSWLADQPVNTAETPYETGLKDINLDSGNNWGDLGIAINGSKWVKLNLLDCTGTAIPDGYTESKTEGGKLIITTYGAFVGCDNLIEIILPKGLKTIGEYVFRECRNLTSVVLPEGITHINDYAFDDCGKLSLITLPEGLKSIGKYTFRSAGLTSIDIPASVNNLGYGAFNKCSSLQSVVMKAEIELLEEATFKDCELLESVVLPANLKTIDKNAFQGCKALATITLPDGLTAIGDHAFSGCHSLPSIIIPDGVRKIGQSTFNKCKSLTSVVLPANLETIGSYTFFECESLNTTVEIPSKVVKIEDYAFAHTSVVTYVMRPAVPPVLGSLSALGTFPLPADFIIKVPAESVDTYKKSAGRFAEDWKPYADKIVANTD